MLKSYFVLLSLALLFNNTYGQNYNWITPNKTYLKTYVADDGIYRLSRTDFTNAGINTSGLDPRTVKVYNKGVQIPIYFQGEQDGTFDAADYFDFYGIRNYGGLTKTYDENNFVVYTTNEYYNFYSDTNIYWIDWGGANGIRMQTSANSVQNLFPNPYYYDLVHLEKDKIYWLGEVLNGNDFRNFTNEKFRGETWYWNLLYNGQSQSDTFSTPLLYNVPQTSTLRIFAYPQSVSLTVFNEHTLKVYVNNVLIDSLRSNDFNKIDTTLNFSSSLLTSTGVNTVSAVYTSNGGFSGTMFIDLFEIQYPKFFKLRNNQTKLLLNGTDTASKQFNVTGFIPSNPINIYDVTANKLITNYSNASDTLKFTGRSNSNFEIINKNITKKPFRIIQRQVPDYVSNTNGADYLLIYNKLFESQAMQLKNHRETYDNFRVVKSEIEDIYDIFNYGLEDPVAIRNFVKHVYDNWQLPKIKYVCLFGRGSLDPKKNSVSTLFSKNLIPVMGNPSSDNYYSNVNIGAFTFYNQIAIGRLPAYTTTEAQNLVENIITYETQPPDEWMKNFSFIAGGTDTSEQSTFLKLNDTLINSHITPSPVSGKPVRILRNDINGAVTYNYADSIKNQINRGTMTINFIGHAGSQDWEIGMSDPNVLTNFNGKFPLVMSMTCYTGKVGEPNFRSFGEKYMTMNNKGAIGYIGTSGWGFIFAGGALNDTIYRQIAKDTVRRIGDIFANSTKKISRDSLSGNVRHTINCYTLMGDPAVKLRLPVQPEYAIGSSDYKLSDNFPNVNQNVTLTAYPKNYGLHSDSCNIRLLILKKYTKYLLKDTVIKNFKFSDSVKFNFKLDSSGTYNVNVMLDYFNYNPFEDKNNNNLSFNLTSRNISFIPVRPVNNSIVRTDSIEFLCLNPFINRNNFSIRVLLEMDTTNNFNSTLKKTFINSNISGVSTKFRTELPRLDTNILYYWRTNSVINTDSSGWSQPQIFRYNPSILSDEKDFILTDSTSTVYKNKSQQYSQEDFYNTNSGTSGIKLNSSTGTLYVRSMGSNGSEASFFSVLNKSVHIDGGSNMGLGFLKVRKLDGEILQFRVFKMLNTTSSDSVLNFLNTFDTTHYLLGLTASYVDAPNGYFLLNQATLNKIHQFGCTKIDTVRRFGWFDSWSFIGYLNASPSQVAESVHRLGTQWVESVSSLNKTFTPNNGTVSYLIGPSNNWKDFSWNNTLLPGSNIKFDVYGIDRNEQQTLLLSNLITNNLVNLNSINAYQFPKLNLISKLNIDTLSGLSSPTLNSFKINYTMPAEIVPDLSTFWKSDTALSPGSELKLKFYYFNAGSVFVPGVIVNIYKTSVSQQNLIKSDTITKNLKIDSSALYDNRFLIPYRLTGKTQFIAEILPKGQNNEFHTFNNYIYFTVKINAPQMQAGVDVFSDGKLIHSGDYVSLKPELKINIKNLKDNFSSATDTTQVKLFLNNFYVSRSEKGNVKNLSKLSDGRTKENPESSFYYYPTLNEGGNKLKIIYKNYTDDIDSIEYDVTVSNELSVKDFYNYPNPMKEQTSFIFNLLGSESPLNSKIKIYTVTGRLIKEINFLPTIGYNQINWDGRDNDGDVIANGTYLYKFIAEDNSKKETAIQKLVVLR